MQLIKDLATAPMGLLKISRGAHLTKISKLVFWPTATYKFESRRNLSRGLRLFPGKILAAFLLIIHCLDLNAISKYSVLLSFDLYLINFMRYSILASNFMFSLCHNK